jgi:hypothetical protein
MKEGMMSSYDAGLTELDRDNDELLARDVYATLNNSPIKLSEMAADEALPIELTRKIAASNLTPYTPSSLDKSLVGRITEGTPVDTEALEEVHSALSSYKTNLEDVETTPVSKLSVAHFPNLGWESVKAGLAKETHTNQKLSEHIKTAEGHQQDINLLLDLSAELTAHKDDATVLSEKAQTTIAQLKNRGIDIWKGDLNSYSKEKISDTKSLINNQIDKLRTNLQIVFTTKIQTLIQAIGTILDAVKNIINSQSRMISAINRLPGR